MSENATGIQIVIIDDDADQADMLKRALLKKDAAESAVGPIRGVVIYHDPAQAVAALESEGPALIFCDYQLGDSTGIDWLPYLLRAGVGPVILMTSQGDERVASKAFRAGASDYLIKMDIFQTPQTLHSSIRNATLHYKLEQSNRELAKELKAANHSLQQKNQRLRDMTDTAHRFVEDVAHEFRTPLTVIKEFASILSDGIGGEVTEKQSEFLGHIESGARNLAQMVDDFLDTSKLRANLLRVDRTAHALQDIYNAVEPILQSRAKTKQVTLAQAFDPGLPAVFCDKDMIGRVLINLIVNAIKFSPEGSRIDLWARLADDGGVEVGVTDQGPGLSEDDQAILGNRLTQTDSGRNSGVKGFGLGLSIARDLITANLGRMHVHSELGKGSTFSFGLPSEDPDLILGRYVKTLTDQDTNAYVSLIHVTADPGKPFDAERVRRFLACHSQSLDLALAPPDGQAVLLLGPTTEPDKWVAVLKQCIEENHARMKTDNVPLDLRITCKDTWKLPEEQDALVDCVSAYYERSLQVA